MAASLFSICTFSLQTDILAFFISGRDSHSHEPYGQREAIGGDIDHGIGTE